MLYANDQKWTEQQRTGYVINRLRDCSLPPTEYMDLVRFRTPCPAGEGGYQVRAGKQREEAAWPNSPTSAETWADLPDSGEVKP